MQKSAIEARAVSKSFKQGDNLVDVLHAVSMTCIQGKSYALTGASGAGKSTLLHILAGLEEPTTGSVLYNNVPLVSFDEQQRQVWLNQTIGIVFQLPYLVAELTVAQNVALKALIQGKRYAEVKEWVEELLSLCGLYEKKNSLPPTLSGGQQQRVALARALCTRPLFLFADEPTGNLDTITGHHLVELILRFQQEWGMGVIICSHDQYVTDALHTVYSVEKGELILQKG